MTALNIGSREIEPIKRKIKGKFYWPLPHGEESSV
jgi:hypothetical protein